MAKWDETGHGGRYELSLVDSVGGTLTLPINPNSIVWRTNMGAAVHQTFRGRHFQAMKVYKTGGRIVIDTGSDRPSQGIKGGKRMKDELAAFISNWMNNAVYHNAGPLRMIMPSQNIDLKVWITTGPEEGIVAQTTHYSITLDFEIAEDISTPISLSGLTEQYIPGFLGNVMEDYWIDINSFSNPLRTAQEVSFWVYNNSNYASVIIGANPESFDSRGQIKAGVTRIKIPYLAEMWGTAITFPWESIMPVSVDSSSTGSS